MGEIDKTDLDPEPAAGLVPHAYVGVYCYHVIDHDGARTDVPQKGDDLRAVLVATREALLGLRSRTWAHRLMPRRFRPALWPHHDADLRRWMHSLLITRVGWYLYFFP
jgi:hypothetical protein